MKRGPARSPLPLRFSSAFVGRAVLLAEVRRALDEHRIVTLLGAPGVGKSRLAAALFTEASTAGFGFCDAGGAGSADELLSRLADASGARLVGDPEASLEALGAALSARFDRLVIDDVDAATPDLAALLAGLLDAAPQLRVIVTSRARLGLEDEALVHVPPLDTSPGGEAEQLFLKRARLVRPDVAVSEAERRDLSELLRALDGLPLAIEIAAAQSRFLPIGALVERMLGPTRERHKDPLWSAIDRSLAGLTPEASDAFAALCVFRGGVALDMAESLLHAAFPPPERASDPSRSAPPDVLAILSELADRSLLTARPAGRRARFVMLNPVRAVAESRLDPARAADLRRRHAALFVGLAERCTDEAVTDPAAALAELGAERDNLAAALETARQDRTIGLEARLSLTLARASVDQAVGPIAALFTSVEAAIDEATSVRIGLKTRAIALLVGLARELDRAGAVIARAQAITEEARRTAERGPLAVALAALGETLTAMGRFEDGARALEEARELERSLARPLREARALHALGVNRIEAGRLGEGRLALREALARNDGKDPLSEARTLSVLGVIEIEEGRLAEARAWLDRALPIAESSGDLRLFALATTNHAVVAHESGDLDAALAEYERAADLCRAAGMGRGEALARAFAGHCLLERGEFARARAAYEDSLARLGREGWRRAMVLGPFAAAAAMAGDVDLAARTLDEADALFREMGQERLALAVPVCRGFLDLAESDRLRARGDEAGAARHVEASRARTQATLVDPTPRGDSAGPALSQQSTDLRVALRALGRAVAERSRAPAPPESSWRATTDAAILTSPAGDRVDLTRRAPLRRVVARLVKERMERPGSVLRVEDLVLAGWPGEAVSPKAGEARVYAAVATLRKLGLAAWLQSTGDGYRLDPSVPVLIPG